LHAQLHAVHAGLPRLRSVCRCQYIPSGWRGVTTWQHTLSSRRSRPREPLRNGARPSFSLFCPRTKLTTRRPGSEDQTGSYAVSFWFPVGIGGKEDGFFRLPDKPRLGIGWTVAWRGGDEGGYSEGGGAYSVNHCSNLPDAWIPPHMLLFFLQLLRCVSARWVEACELAQQHLPSIGE
jgi:hypothetical protein